MGMKCKVCSDSRKIEIDRALLAGGNVSKVSKKFDLPYMSVYRHRDKHISRQLVKSQEVRDSLTGKHLLNVVQDVLENCKRIMHETGHDPKQYNISLTAAGKVLSVVQLLHEITTNLLEYQQTEKDEKQTNHEKDYMAKLNRLSIDEMKTLKKLQQKMLGIEPGKRNDLILTPAKQRKERARQKRESNERYRKKTLAEQSKPVESSKSFKRRKVAPKKAPAKPVNEFDGMRNRLNMPNDSEPLKKGWLYD